MDRREFLFVTGSAVLAGATFSSGQAGTVARTTAKRLTLTVAKADSVNWVVDEARELARRIEQTSGERFAVAVADPLNVKAVGLKLLRASELIEIDRAFGFATGLPGSAALEAEAVDAWLTEGGGQAALDELAAGHGLKVLLAAHSGEQFLWSKKSLRTAADFAGKCIKAEAMACYVAAGLGAEPWRIVPSDESGHLESGAVAAIEASIPDAIAQGLLQTARYASTGALAPHGSAVALTIRLEMWDAMSPADQAAITAAARENYRESLSVNHARSAMNRSALQQTYGVVISPVTHDVAATIQTIAGSVISQAASGCPAAAKLNASYNAFLRRQQILAV